MSIIGVNFSAITKKPATLVYYAEGIGYIKLNQLLTFNPLSSYSLAIGYQISIQPTQNQLAFIFLPNMELLQSGIQAEPLFIPAFTFPRSLTIFLQAPNYQTRLLPGTILGTFSVVGYNNMNITSK